MGISSDGILFFGLDLGTEPPWGSENISDINDYVASKLGLDPPDVPFDENRKIYSEYWDKKKKILDRSCCELDMHCSYDYEMYLVCLSKKKFSASRGYPLDLPDDFHRVTDSDIEKLKKFCDALGIKWSKPRWILTSFYG
jgi:hypothetical protein